MFQNTSQALIVVSPNTSIAPGEMKSLSERQLSKKDVQRLIKKGVLRATDVYEKLEKANSVSELVALSKENVLDRDFVSTALAKAEELQKSKK
jgi:hypothetical protein